MKLAAPSYRHLYAGGLGLIFCLGLAPWDLWPVSLFSVYGLWALLEGRSARQGFFLGWAYGIGLWGSGVSWLWVSIHEHGATSAWLAALMVLFVAVVMGSLSGLQAALYRRYLARSASWIGFTGAWVLFEWLRSWLFTGFPWLYLGDGLIDTPLAGYAPLGGVFMVSGFACLSALMLARLDLRRGLFLALLWFGGHRLFLHDWTQAQGHPLSVSLVQGNIDQDSKWDVANEDAIIATYRRLSQSEWGRDIVLWPEAAITKFYDEATSDLQDLQALAQSHGTTLITGIPYAEPYAQDYLYFNTVIALGEGAGLYAKQRLVPFGEYVPMAPVLRGLMPFFDLPMSGFTPGPEHQPPLRAGLWRVQPSICYEVAYPDLLQRQAAAADLLVTVSNDAWFGHSHGPQQHFAMVRMRALETGRYFLSATNNGITAVVDPKGRVLARAPSFRPYVLRAEVHAMRHLTPWLVWGETPTLLLAVLACLAGRGRGGRRDSATPFEEGTHG